ncbi:MAG TPA: FHA domain-containing serine/threonine-protein kinase [Planctomycetota bacterium]|nr:FHA domain-containing serine/threonine-protein kinase [Planctomycetota bacterium]
MPRLVVERGNERGASINLDAPEVSFTAGRLKSCDLVLTDTLVSRQHFRINGKDGVFTITDLESHNGTYVNGQRIQGEVELPEGATIRAGETLLAFKPDSKSDEGALAGKKLGGYQVLNRIGVGGMGEVYKATQLSLTREVALKVLSPDLVKDRAFVERFLSEARAAGKFNHPNVVHVHEVGEESGYYYYSMEYLEGGSVHDQVSRGRKLDPERATEIILQATRALEYAEKVGIVHCDIKPDNLMLTGTGEVRLADLGIAKSLNEKGKAEQSDGVFGSPNYMSPEQARGLPLDHRSDLYSLGVTYYRILLGKVPFTGKDAKRIMEKVVFDEPESPRKLDPNLPPMIYSILAKLLKKKPSDRYQKAAELVADLETALEQCHQNIRGTTSGPLPKIGTGKFQRRSGRFFGK